MKPINANQQPIMMMILVAILVTTGQLALTLYLPSLPAIASAFNISVGLSQDTLSIFLLGMGLSQLFYGPLSDHYGRRKILFIGQFILLLGTLLVLGSQSATTLLLGRLLQGLGAGSSSVLVRAILRDCFSGKKLSSAMSILIMSVSITPTLSPVLGGYLQAWFGWQSNFIFLFIYVACIITVMYLFLPETATLVHNQKFKLYELIPRYLCLLKNKVALLFLICIVLPFSCQMLYLSILPFVLQKQFSFTASDTGLIMLIPSFFIIVGNYLSRQLMALGIEMNHVMLTGAVFIFLSGSILLLSHYFDLTFLIMVIGVCITSLGITFLFANATAGLLHPFPNAAGLASGLAGCFQMLGGGIINTSVGFLHFEKVGELGVLYLSFGIILIVIVRIIGRVSES